MTIDKCPIDKIKPGREMDWMIAEKVMGVTKDEFDEDYAVEGHNYSTLMVDAWRVVEKLKDLGCEIHLDVHKKPFLYWCTIYWPNPPAKWSDPKTKIVHSMKRRKRLGDDDVHAWASYVETMPLAICRATLRYLEVQERIRENASKPPPDYAAEARTLVAKFFDGNEEKTSLWMATKNPLLGNISPEDMIRLGRVDRLLKFIKDALAENERPEGREI